MVGVPASDEGQIATWVHQLLTPDDEEYQTSEEDRRKATRDFMEYAHALAAERRRSPSDDLLSRLMAAEVEGQKLTYEEFGMLLDLDNSPRTSRVDERRRGAKGG